jgi:hypothetical protein
MLLVLPSKMLLVLPSSSKYDDKAYINNNKDIYHTVLEKKKVEMMKSITTSKCAILLIGVTIMKNLSCWQQAVNAFTTTEITSTMATRNVYAPVSRRSTSSPIFLSSTDDQQQQQQQQQQQAEQQLQQQKPDLVDQKIFLSAIDRVRAEIDAQIRSQEAEAAAAAAEERGEVQQQQQQQQDQDQELMSKEEEAKQDGYIYLVGKIDCTLPIGTQPELDLTESDGPLVLVTGVGDNTRDATGMQQFDTITKVIVNDETNPMVIVTKQTTLQETGGALMAASQHALTLGKSDIQLEVQRLIKGYYAPEASA